jgi:hypothetical protein
MKSGFYYTNPERGNPIKPFEILFKYNFTIRRQKNAMIIMAMIISKTANPSDRFKLQIIPGPLRTRTFVSEI